MMMMLSIVSTPSVYIHPTDSNSSGSSYRESPRSNEGGGNISTRSAEELRNLLRRIDGAGYGAYRDMDGAFEYGPSGMYLGR